MFKNIKNQYHIHNYLLKLLLSIKNQINIYIPFTQCKDNIALIYKNKDTISMPDFSKMFKCKVIEPFAENPEIIATGSGQYYFNRFITLVKALICIRPILVVGDEFVCSKYIDPKTKKYCLLEILYNPLKDMLNWNFENE